MRAGSSWASGGDFCFDWKASDFVGQSIKGKVRNAEESLRNDQQLFGEDAQLHFLPRKVAAKVAAAVTSTTKFFNRVYIITRISSKL